MEGWSKIYFPLLAQQRTAAWLISTDHAGGVMECLERKHEDPDQNALKVSVGWLGPPSVFFHIPGFLNPFPCSSNE